MKIVAAQLVLDTNILIDFLNDVEMAVGFLERHAEAAISPVTWMEVLVGTPPDEEEITREWLASFRMLPLDRSVYEMAVALRKNYRNKLPDALIWATARAHGFVLVTRNVHDFLRSEPDIHVPYTL